MSDAKIQTESGSTLSNSSNKGTIKSKTERSLLSDYADEVIILPTPEKPKPPLITLDESPKKGNNNERNKTQTASIAINSEQKGTKATKKINKNSKNNFFPMNRNSKYYVSPMNKNSETHVSPMNKNSETHVSPMNKKSKESKTLNNNNAVTKKVASYRILKSNSTKAGPSSLLGPGPGVHNNLASLNARNVFYSYHTSNYASYYYNPNNIASYPGTFSQGNLRGTLMPGYYNYRGSSYRNQTVNSYYNLFTPNCVDFGNEPIANVQNNSVNATADTQTSGKHLSSSANSHEITKNRTPESNQRISSNLNAASCNNAPQIVRLSSVNDVHLVDPACNSSASPANQASINTCGIESSILEKNSSQPINISTNNSEVSLAECASGNKGNDLLQIHQNSCPVIDNSNAPALVTNTKTLEKQKFVNTADDSTPSFVKPTNGEKVSVLSEIHQNSGSHRAKFSASLVNADKEIAETLNSKQYDGCVNEHHAIVNDKNLQIPFSEENNKLVNAEERQTKTFAEQNSCIVNESNQSVVPVSTDKDNGSTSQIARCDGGLNPESGFDVHDKNASSSSTTLSNISTDKQNYLSIPVADSLNVTDSARPQCSSSKLDNAFKIINDILQQAESSVLKDNDNRKVKKNNDSNCSNKVVEMTNSNPPHDLLNSDDLGEEDQCNIVTYVSFLKQCALSLSNSLKRSKNSNNKFPDSFNLNCGTDIFTYLHSVCTEINEELLTNENSSESSQKTNSIFLNKDKASTAPNSSLAALEKQPHKDSNEESSSNYLFPNVMSQTNTKNNENFQGNSNKIFPATDENTVKVGSLTMSTKRKNPSDQMNNKPKKQKSYKEGPSSISQTTEVQGLNSDVPNISASAKVTNSSDVSSVLSLVSPDSTTVNDNDIEANLQRNSRHSILASAISEDASLDIAIDVTMIHSKIEDSIAKELNLAPYDKSNLPETEEGLIEELKTLASQEKSLKQKKEAAFCQLNKAKVLVERYTTKHNKIKEMHSCLRKKRFHINKLLKAFEEKNKTRDLVEVPVPTKRKCAKPSEASTCSSEKRMKEDDNSGSTCSSEKRMKEDDNSGCSQSASTDVNNVNTALRDTNNEVILLPIPAKPDPPLIILDEEATTAHVSKGVAKLGDKKLRSNVSKFFKEQSCHVYCGLINQIEIFDDFLYVCSSDGTANRTYLKDHYQVVSYRLTEMDGLIKKIIVGKAQNKTIVFAQTNKNLVVILDASNGKRIAVFSEAACLMSICKGWDKFYSGWSDGTIHIYSWTAEKGDVRKEIHQPKQIIVKTHQPMCSLATTVEGNLPFLLLLTGTGKIIVRGVETAVYIRSIEVKNVVPPIFAVHQNYVYFCSKLNVLSVFNFLTRKAETTLAVDKQIVGIAFSGKYVFTIMAKSSEVNCYNLDKLSERRRICNVDGWGHLTSICVYGDLVLVGNDKGKVFSFKFYIQDSFSCKFGDCKLNFDSMNRLHEHLKHVHICTASICEWWNCRMTLVKEKRKQVNRHFRRHVKKQLGPRPFFSFV